MEKIDEEGEKFILQAIDAMRSQRQNTSVVYPIRKCTSDVNFNYVKSHVEEPKLQYKNGQYSIFGGHLIDRYNCR